MGKKSRENKNNAEKYKNNRKANILPEKIEDEFHRTKNGKIYHKECYETMLKASEFTRMWQEAVNRDEPIGRIKSAFYKNVYELGFPPEYNLFGLKYCVDTGKVLNYPPGLKFYLQNEELKNAYKKACLKKNGVKTVNMKEFRVENNDKPAQNFNYTEKKRGFGVIFEKE